MPRVASDMGFSATQRSNGTTAGSSCARAAGSVICSGTIPYWFVENSCILEVRMVLILHLISFSASTVLVWNSVRVTVGFSEELDVQLKWYMNWQTVMAVRRDQQQRGTVKEVCRTQKTRQSQREQEETFSNYVQVREGQSKHKEKGKMKQALRKSGGLS